MKSKIFALLLVAIVLTSSFAVSVLPTVNALTVRTDFSDRHLSASYGNSPICGDHICGPGERTQWMTKMAQLQRVGAGKIGGATNSEEALKNILSNSTSTVNSNVIENTHMNENMTSMDNMTKVMK